MFNGSSKGLTWSSWGWAPLLDGSIFPITSPFTGAARMRFVRLLSSQTPSILHNILPWSPSWFLGIECLRVRLCALFDMWGKWRYEKAEWLKGGPAGQADRVLWEEAPGLIFKDNIGNGAGKHWQDGTPRGPPVHRHENMSLKCVF